MSSMSATQPDDWFEIRTFDDGVIGIGEPGHDEDVKSYLVIGRDQALLIDSGMGVGNIKRVVAVLTDKPVLLVNSHSHWDHIGDSWRFDRVWVHEAEAEDLRAGVENERMRRALAPERLTRPLPANIDPQTFAIPGVEPERTLRGGELIDLGDRTFVVVPTPGHSPGGITLVDEANGVALVADAVYAGALYAHIPGHSDPVVYRETLRRLAELAPSLKTIYPSHNDYPLPASFLKTVHDGYEAIWSGRAPDTVEDGVERFVFDGFSVLIPVGWRG
jgi:glyoxylase-like metal-dependent hydrolase (beta-lactamase superfamily II)